MYTLYKFHFLNGISEINQLFDDILIIWPAPVYIYKNSGENYLIPCWFRTFAHWNDQSIILMVDLFELWETE